MTAALLPDVEAAAKAWAKAHALLTPQVAGRVFYGYPAGEPALPLITVAELIDTPDPGPHVTACRLTWQVWGENKQQASDAKRALVAAMRDVQGAQLAPGCWCDYVDAITSVWLPDDEARLARYVVDATFLVRAMTAQ